MGRPLRDYRDDTVYHLTARAIAERPLFSTDTDRQDFAIRLRRCAASARLRLYAVCLMGTHAHIVVHGSVAISAAMRRLAGSYARAYNARHGRRGSLFEERYTDTPIADEEHLAATVLYVEANAVRAGLVADVGDWPWSTHAASPLRALLRWQLDRSY